ncbi:MAG: preprotein translocase subunit SecE [Gemmataceae bacterium]
MAVAVKTPQGTSSAGSLTSPAILSLVGVVYLLACFAIVFKLLPDLWWSVWESRGLGAYTFVGGSLLALVGLTLGVALLWLGVRLLGPNPPVGIRAGVFTGFVGLNLVVLLTRWASLWFEHWSYHGRMFPPSTGLTLTVVVGAALLLGWLRWFTLPRMQKFLVQLEEMGWFHATSYKPNQGLTVRRGTVAGLLMIVGAGIYTLISHHTLEKGPPNWGLNLPFSGKVAVQNFGDTLEFLGQDSAASAVGVSQVQIRWPGPEGSEFRAGQVVSFDRYRSAVERILKAETNSPSLAPSWDELAKSAERPAAFIQAVGKQVVGARLQEMLSSNFYGPGVTERLRVRFEQAPWEDLGEIVPDFYREAETVTRTRPELTAGPQFLVPLAVPVVDRYALRNINDQLDESKNVKILFKRDSKFEEGQIVSREAFDEEVARLEAEKKEKSRDRELPERASLTPASGPVMYETLTLLPSVQFTVPLLLLAGSLWLAWRVVNMPAFADFLIATEAEMNKVSWTTQKRLIQDTIVVLVTTLLMAVFLFGMDIAWKQILSWKYVGVLYIPKEEDTQKNKPTDQKRW